MSESGFDIDLSLPYLCRNASLWEYPPKEIPLSAEETEAYRKGKTSYYPDVALSFRVKHGEEILRLTGTAHGVEWRESGATLDEYLALSSLDQAHGERLERARLRGKILAFFLTKMKNLSSVDVRIVIFSQGEARCETETFTSDELQELFSSLLPRIAAMAAWFSRKEGKIRFPHPALRDGQKELMQSVYGAIKNGRRFYACAPTGVGKTLSVLYPAMKALEKGSVRQIFYLSPKNTLKKQAFETAKLLQKEVFCRVLQLTGKMALCPRRLEECEMRSCPEANGFYTRLPDALNEVLKNDFIDADVILKAAASAGVCPFELSLAAMPFCRVVICDYNHAFAPGASVVPPGEGKVMLIDEAHNLPIRLREAFSESLSAKDFDPLFKDETLPAKILAAECGDLMAFFARRRKEQSENKTLFEFKAPKEFALLAEKWLKKAASALKGECGPLSEETEKNVKALVKKTKNFLFLARDFSADYAFLPDADGGGKIALLHPRGKIDQKLASWQSAVFFSATLLPKEYYFETLAGRDGDPFLALPSPFPRENLFVGICDVDVTFRQRFQTAPKLCGIIRSASLSRIGNYIVYLPSFEYLNFLAADYKKRFVDQKVLVQTPVMNARERKAFLEEFQKPRPFTMIAFCVMGGIFAEGIDLKGDSLSGVICVGTGFPPPGAEAEAESASYYEKGLDGKSFAYTLPGFNRVLQAGGRVIRSETDRGILILADQRFCGEEIKELFPAAWEDARILLSDGEIRKELAKFW